MNFSKSILSVAAVSTVLGAAIAPSVLAWGDNAGGREAYTGDQITAGVLGDKIVFNSISDNPVIGGDERNFVAARFDDGNNGANNHWNNNEITVEDGKTYVVRLYVHNDNPNGEAAVAKNVKATVSVPLEIKNSQTIVGYLESSNALQTRIWDEVTLKADSDFYLEYVDGSALWENNGMGSTKLSNNLITTGVNLGYSSLNGEIPGCYNYDGFVTIRVTAHFTKDFTISKQVRIKGETEWKESVNAKVGDIVEYMITYQNLSGKTVSNVLMQDILPSNMKYVEKSTKIKNAENPEGKTVDADTLTKDGINIGDYENKGNAYVIFQAEVIKSNLNCGKENQLVNWAKVTAGSVTRQDDASVIVNGETCPETPKELPKTGASSIVVSALGLGSVVTASGYYIASRKKLM